MPNTQSVVAETGQGNKSANSKSRRRKGTSSASASSLGTTAKAATTPKKNITLLAVDMASAKTKLAIVAEDVYQFNKKTGGRMTYHPLSDGKLLIVASLPGHRLGVVDTGSGMMIAIDGKAVTDE